MTAQARRAVVLVGGLGSRLRPLTLTRPKHLLPVGGRPLLDLVLGRLAESGVTEAVLAVSVHADLIAAHVRRRGALPAGLSVRLSVEEEPLGTGGAIATASALLAPAPAEPVVVLNGDLLTGHDLAAQTALLAAGADLALHVRSVADPSPFGTVRCADDGRVLDFAEKVPGPPGTLVNAGTYVVRGAVLAALPPHLPGSWERDHLPRLVAGAADVRAHAEQAWFADVGTPAALVAASVAVLSGAATSAVPAALRAVGPLQARCDPAAEVDALTSAGAGGQVEAGARVCRSVLLDRVVVGAGAVVEDSVLGEGVVVGPGAVVVGAALGDGTQVRAGESITAAARSDVAGGHR